MMNEKLRVGLLLDSFALNAWEYAMLERIINSDYAAITLVVLRKESASGRIDCRRIVYDVYSKIDKKLFPQTPDAFEIKDGSKILSGVPFIKVTLEEVGCIDRIELGDINKIKGFELDVFIKLALRNLSGDIFNVAKYGVWSYCHGDTSMYKGGPAGFWEVVEDCPETGSALQVLSKEHDSWRDIYRSWTMTHRLSPAKNRNKCYWNSVSFVPRKLEELWRTKELKFLERIAELNESALSSSNRKRKAPNNIEAARIIARQLFKVCFRLFQRVFYKDQWSLLFSINEDTPISFSRFRRITPPRDRYWADPHIIFKDQRYYIFIEEYMHKNKKGHISLIEMDKEGRYSKPVNVLEKEYHLSYPFIFERLGVYYMVPETSENKTIELYESEEFPYKWKFRMNLMENVRAFDSTLFYYRNKWWLFTCIIENEGAWYDEQFLFLSEELFSNNWVYHQSNPIVSDVKNARSAGNVFMKNGKLFRPAQNGSKSYGYGFNINEILELDEHNYKEKIVSSVKSDWDRKIKGIHTYNNCEKLTMVDIFINRPKFFNQ